MSNRKYSSAMRLSTYRSARMVGMERMPNGHQCAVYIQAKPTGVHHSRKSSTSTSRCMALLRKARCITSTTRWSGIFATFATMILASFMIYCLVLVVTMLLSMSTLFLNASLSVGLIVIVLYLASSLSSSLRMDSTRKDRERKSLR